MGLVDGIIGGVVGAMVYGASNVLGSLVGAVINVIRSLIRGPERWELIKVEEEEKNFSFGGDPVSGYNILYTGKNNGDRFGRTGGSFLSRYDLKAYDVKTENAAIYFLIYKLEVQHDWLKNRKLATLIARKLHADIMEKLKDPKMLKEINYTKWNELYGKTNK
ncbi:hypothetical protein HYT84_02470 [Candidatus Micrarchaeota archaeon]|nr:hypothetical protein [Candidatus Micrarchaeota archaeon]